VQEWKTTKIKRETLLRLRSVKVRFDFKSLDEVFTTFMAIRDKMCWDKNDMLCMAKYGKLPEVVAVQGGSDEECLRKLGLGGPETGKVGEISNVEEIGKASTELLKEKRE
jgi:hypothetical protein